MSTGTTTDYAGKIIYENNVFKMLSNPEGYLEPPAPSSKTGAPTYVYQYKDHLGNIRLNYFDNDGTLEIIEEHNYYPFGLKHRGYNDVVSANVNSQASKYKYQGQEFEDELGKDTYAYQWRDYDPALGRFGKIDRFAEKYESHSSYAFTINNPIKYREIAGDSISVTRVAIYDNANNTNYQQQLVNDWQQQTGLTLNVDANTGVMTYATDANGDPIISTTIDANGNAIENGSASARADLISYIDGNGVTDIGITPNDSATPHGGNEIWLGDSQITSFINGTPAELNDRTLGVGMTAFHEFRHTAAGGSHIDPIRPGSTDTGPVVDRVNVYRQELDNNPANAGARPYGQRTSYQATNRARAFGPPGVNRGAVPGNSSLRFRYHTTNRRGRIVRRSTNIRF
ncbi:RHS repeat-associated core domain-containing protein [Winogradskyella sp.]|uniref:RHS repeat-associated core domain-containing protein n=1 Tax=Winogradskyella sp. TaxID=1883156 RepID=UPI003BAC8703